MPGDILGSPVKVEQGSLSLDKPEWVEEPKDTFNWSEGIDISLTEGNFTVMTKPGFEVALGNAQEMTLPDVGGGPTEVCPVGPCRIRTRTGP